MEAIPPCAACPVSFRTLLLLKTADTITRPLRLRSRGAEEAATAAAVLAKVVPREAMLEPCPDRLAMTWATKMARLRSIKPKMRISMTVADRAYSRIAWPESRPRGPRHGEAEELSRHFAILLASPK